MLGQRLKNIPDIKMLLAIFKITIGNEYDPYATVTSWSTPFKTTWNRLHENERWKYKELFSSKFFEYNFVFCEKQA